MAHLFPVAVASELIVTVYSIDVALTLYRYFTEADWTHLGKAIPKLLFVGIYGWFIWTDFTPVSTIQASLVRDGLLVSGFVGILYNTVRIIEKMRRAKGAKGV